MREAIQMELDIENFDYEAEFQKIKATVAKPNILVTGATGAGKSSLINHLFGEDTAPVGEGRPVTKEIHPYSSPNLSVNLYDSQGYEVEDCDENFEYRNNVLGFIDERKGSDDIETQIHEVWHCISASGKRVTDMDIDIVGEIKERNLPVAIVFTQIDGVDEAELAELVERAEEACEGVAHFAVCCVKNDAIQERLKSYLQWTELLDWAIENLDSSLREGFVSSLKGSLKEKREMVLGQIIPMYTAIASGIGAVPIPFADAFALIPLQVKMSMHIMSAYGLDDMTGISSRAIESFAVSQVGRFVARTLASNLLKLIPVAGSLVGGAANATVAGGFTYSMGKAVCELAHSYVYRTVIKGKKIPISEAFTSTALLGSLV
jgi:uncharacterized protein (DUF697 family)/GTP-binding protein EngB required for normal cell division